jgi:hypothetical protein
MKIKISKREWLRAGQSSGWMPRDPINVSDRDLNPMYTAQDEENALLGKEESQESVDKSVYEDGFKTGASKENDSSTCPYRSDTKLSNIWWEGFKKGKESKSTIAKTIKTVKIAQNLENVKTPERFNDRELTRAIRDAIIAEEGAIKQYEAVVDATDNEEAKKVLQSISDEEKVHVGELQKLLNDLLPDEEEHLKDGEKEVEDAEY